MERKTWAKDNTQNHGGGRARRGSLGVAIRLINQVDFAQLYLRFNQSAKPDPQSLMNGFIVIQPQFDFRRGSLKGTTNGTGLSSKLSARRLTPRLLGLD